MPKETCYFHVQKDQEGNIQAEKVEIDVETLRPNQILTSPLFGLETIRHISNPSIENLEGGNDYREIAQRKETQDLLKKLSEKFKTNKQNEENQ